LGHSEIEVIMPLKRITLVLLLIILLPALFFTGYELNSLSANEKLLSEIYRRQLDAILFSVNQYAWDRVNNWVSKLNLAFIESRDHSDRTIQFILQKFLSENRNLPAAFLLNTQTQSFVLAHSQQVDGDDAALRQILTEAFETQQELLARLERMKRSGYRKIESIMVPAFDEQDSENLALIFVSELSRADIAGLVLNGDLFVQQVLSPKLQEAAGQEFILAVFQENRSQPIFSTTPIQLHEIKQQKNLWLFPNHFLGIRPQGETFEELARSRFYRSLLLIIILDFVLILGASVVYRNIKREMELSRLKSDFVSNVSHELKTPLSLIRMFAETLEMGRMRSESKRKEYYHIISQETERLTHLVNNLLNFSRMEAGKKQYHLEMTNLNTVVEKVMENYRVHLQKQGFDISLRLSENLPEIAVDAESISEALLNLLDNAVKYSEREKYIAVKTGMDHSELFLEVEDHGVGIAPEHQDKIFDKFYRVSAGLVHNTQGSGLGLTLVRHIMEAHGGKVIVRSRPGQGSCFRLVLRNVAQPQIEDK
jgi:two-component system phosphate regulon sensor histidine kinase PhoR